MGQSTERRMPLQVIAGRLFDLGACLNWIADTEANPAPASALIEQHVRGRLLGAVASHGLACIRTLWDAIPLVLDIHIARKPGQLPDSFNDLLVGVEGGKYASLLPDGIRKAILGASCGFRLCRKLRDGLLHNGYQVIAWFHEEGTHLNLSKNYFDVISDRKQEGLHWYRVWPLLGGLLYSWVDFWRAVADEATDYASVPEHERNRVFAFCSPTMGRLAEILGVGSQEAGYWFLWPCGADCAGSIGGCENPAGAPPAGFRVRWSPPPVQSLVGTGAVGNDH